MGRSLFRCIDSRDVSNTFKIRYKNYSLSPDVSPLWNQLFFLLKKKKLRTNNKKIKQNPSYHHHQEMHKNDYPDHKKVQKNKD